MIFEVAQDVVVAKSVVPADNITSTTIEEPTKYVEANNYNEIECVVVLHDPVAGTKSVVFTVYTGGEPEIDDANFTAWTQVYTETVALGTAAYDGWVAIKLDQKKFSKKYASFKAVVTHADPGATPATTVTALLVGHGDHRRD